MERRQQQVDTDDAAAEQPRKKHKTIAHQDPSSLNGCIFEVAQDDASSAVASSHHEQQSPLEKESAADDRVNVGRALEVKQFDS
ncbi:hypothetical protein GN244_ATG01850 [Phytophthora infestans]|uniref:Uncharacterized protein n=1 Tax=Phytophthora infestans TaxID=4787 RepID=A0A833W7L1_PHYIN|nr:hypothetical protein GN244_ATG01850 [Phytophthora infestans]